jgi:hypothetical protein
MSELALNVTIADGKYTVRQASNGRVFALRYGEPWRDCTGDGLIFRLAEEIQDLREKLEASEKQINQIEP